MVFRIKLIGYSILIWLLNNFIWLWDVVFTQIDIIQLKLWNKLELSLDSLRTDRYWHEKNEIQKDGIDSWE